MDGRAEAWRSGDPALLYRVLATGSPALDSEAAALTEAQDQGLRYPDVSFRVEDARVVREEDGRVTVEAVVARDELRAVGADGTAVREEPASTDDVRLVLSRPHDQASWRLWSWGPASG